MKSDKATTRRRIEAVLELRTLGATFFDIRQYASVQEPPWKVSDRQLWRYVEESDRLMAETLEKDRKKIVSRHRAQRRAIYSRSMATSDYRTALAALDSEVRLLRLNEPPAGKVANDAKPATPSDLIAILSRRLAEVDGSREMPAGDKSRLTATLADAILRAVQTTELEKQLGELMKRLDALEEKPKVTR